MKFDLSFERLYPHPREKVWHGLTDAEALGRWLMETDFVPERGASFQMWCENLDGGTDRYLCRVVDIEPMSRMLWSWKLAGAERDYVTFVEFRLETAPDGTLLTIRHTGEEEPALIDAWRGGWPGKLDRLAATVGGA